MLYKRHHLRFLWNSRNVLSFSNQALSFTELTGLLYKNHDQKTQYNIKAWKHLLAREIMRSSLYHLFCIFISLSLFSNHYQSNPNQFVPDIWRYISIITLNYRNFKLYKLKILLSMVNKVVFIEVVSTKNGSGNSN